MEQKYLNIKLISVLIGFLAFDLIMPKVAFSQYYSQGDTKRSISVDKKIRPINDNKSYDNVGKDDKIFTSGNSLDFSILIENTGNQELTNLKVKDYLPAFQEVVFNPGTYDRNAALISFDIEKLGVGESKLFTIRTKVVGVKSTYTQMLTNKACVNGDNIYDCDQASFFVQGQLVPSTGSGTIILQSLVGISGALIALLMRKISRGY